MSFSGPGITDNCELFCGCMEKNPSPLQEQQTHLTAKHVRPCQVYVVPKAEAREGFLNAGHILPIELHPQPLN